MKVVNFIKTGMENFSCYTNLIEFPFRNDKITLITGPNGAGKTTMYDSVPFSLYGETTKGTKSSDVVNNTVGKNCHTYVEFTIEHENNIIDKYRVDRYVKDSKLGDTVLLFKNDEKKPYKKGHKEVLPEIEKLLVPQRLFMNTLLFGQKVKDFFTDLTDNEKKDIFRKVLQLDNYVLYYDETNREIKICNEKLLQVKTNLDFNERLTESTRLNIEKTNESIKNFEDKKNEEIQSLTQEIQGLNDDLDLLIEISKEYENVNDLELKQIQRDISTGKNELDNIKTEKNHQLKSLKDARNSKESEINARSKELKSEKVLEKTNLISGYESSYQKIKSEIQMESKDLQSDFITKTNICDRNLEDIRENKKKIEKLSAGLNQPDPVCPTCNTKLTNENVKNHLQEELNGYLLENESKQKEVDVFQEESIRITTARSELMKKAKEEEEKYNTKVKEVEEYCDKALKDIDEKRDASFDKLEISYNEKVDEIENKFIEKENELTRNISELQRKESDLEHLLDEKKKNENQIFRVKSDIDVSKAKLSHKENSKYDTSMLTSYYEEQRRLSAEWKELNSSKASLTEHLEILEFWKNAFSSTGIPSLLIDESIPFLNKTVAEYLDMIGGRYVVSFDTISATKAGEYRDKINVNVLDTQTKANHRKQLSGGQTRVIDIAILLSLCDLQNNVQNMKTNILLLDEIFDSLDEQNIGYISTLLRTLIKGKAVNIISHRHIDSIEADEVMRLF